jgi:sugar phosphate permease
MDRESAPQDDLAHAAPSPEGTPTRAWLWLGILVLGYIGVYLCRKNLMVANPILQREWHLSKEEVGTIASVSTVVYALGKFILGPLVDRLGGRVSLISGMLLVAVFGALGAFAPTLVILSAAYSANRFFGSACWGAAVKLVPDWFDSRRMAFAVGILALSYVFGGVLAVSFAGIVASLSGDNWRWIMGAPSMVLAVLVLVCAWILPRPRSACAVDSTTPVVPKAGTAPPVKWLELLSERRFHIICVLSFALTFLREAFNFWTVDFLQTEGGDRLSGSAAAFLSIPFDLLGGLGILVLGWLYGRISPVARGHLLCGLLLLLAALLWVLPDLARGGVTPIIIALGAIGFLVYGPYSLLSGILAVEVCGKECAATVAGVVDGVGYLAGVLSGTFFGWLLTLGGYRLGFQCLAGVTAVAGGLCLFLYRRTQGDVAASPSLATSAKTCSSSG